MTKQTKIVLNTDFPDLRLIKRGKVRDIYDLGQHMLLVATDRLSAFDVVLPDGIPSKGDVLTAISAFWFSHMKPIVDNHIVTTDVNDFPDVCQQYRETLQRRTMLVKKARPLEVECIVRGYISGSAWKEYKRDGTVCSIKLPQGLRESERLPEPIFTPSTKAEQGHDVNISFDEAVSIVGRDVAQKIKELSLAIYNKAGDYALGKGIIIADTKFEFGISDGRPILIDEVLTPDSSRFWPLKDYAAGRAQESFDKQIVRDYLLTLDWNMEYPGPRLPEEIIAKTSQRYKEILEILSC
ncbi:MAG: phosphoribosylaminoimidazolesuccinocarboxamide synthase [Candidatus Magnetominusculus sp. LBB02]|nr:phosphoribosylaminoimidazolesuccinocarboxamide synthase [Candidatus Magnetominusculus sp. LBB02]